MAGTLGTVRGQVRLDVRQAVAAYAAVRAQNAQTVYAMRGTGDSFVAAGKVMTVAGLGVVYAFGKMVLAAGEFERKMDFFGAVTGASSKEIEKLSDFTLQLAQDTIYSADEIADGIIELGKAGVSTKQVIGGIGEAMANLGAAGDIPLMESGQIITSTVQQFDLAAKDAVKVTDLLAGAANASIADITDIGVSLKYVGGVANAAGLGLEDTITAISLLAKAGIRGSTAGTSLRQMIVSLGGATGPARKQLTELGIITEDGTNLFFDAEGKAKSLSKVFQILQDHTADLTQKERLMALRTIFNNRALSAASILTREGAKGFKDMNKEMSKTTAAEVARDRLDNLSGDIEILKGNIQTLIIKGGGPFQKTARQLVQSITRLVQAFANLPPETQENILKFIAAAGFVLVLMGTFNLIIGVIFKFLASARKLAAGIKFASKFFRILIGVAGRLVIMLGTAIAGALGISLGVFALIVAAVIALIAVYVILYKKVDFVRNAVDNFVGTLLMGLKAVVKFFRTLVKDPSAALDMLLEAVAAFGRGMLKILQAIPRQIGDVLMKRVVPIFSQLVSRSGDELGKLPGRVLGVLVSFARRIGQIFTLKNVLYAVQFASGKIISFFVKLPLRIFLLVLKLVQGIQRIFGQLAPKVGFAIGFLIGRVVGLMLRLGARMAVLALKAVLGVGKFFATLPGRIASFLLRMVNRANQLMIQFAKNLPRYAGQAKDGVVNFIQDLPGAIGRFLVRMVNSMIRNGIKFRQKAIDYGRAAFRGLVDGIRNLPTEVGAILNRCVEAIKGVIRSAFNATKSFAEGMWNGFKKGLKINSPSIIEKQMFQITRVTDEETKKLKRNVLRVQGISKNLAKTNFGLQAPDMSVNTSGLAKLARDQAANRNRAGALLAAQGRRAAQFDQSVRRERKVAAGPQKLQITNWRTGEGYFYDIAQQSQDDQDSYATSLKGFL